jgi:hypothetical protein
MFGLSNKFAEPSPPARTLRDRLFDDAPMSAWPSEPSEEPSEYEPWQTFIRARDAVAAGNPEEAVAAWRAIVNTPGLESRHYGQAWHFLRQHDVQPSSVQAKQLLGVVLEVHLDTGVDLLAAYPEKNARYYHGSGRGVIWEHPDDSLDPQINALLAAGQHVLNAIGPWTEPRPVPPPIHHVRLNFLSPAGLHFGQAPLATFEKDPMAGPVLAAGVMLMRAMVDKSEKR